MKVRIRQLAMVGIAIALPAIAQQTNYVGTNITGTVVRVRAINATQAARSPSTTVVAKSSRFGAIRPEGLSGESSTGDEFASTGPTLRNTFNYMKRSSFSVALAQSVIVQSLGVNPTPGGTGFRGLTHFDQRQSNGGNQFSIEPPSPGIAVANGYVVEGVNNAFQVYTTAGQSLLPRVLSTNELFGIPPAINRTTNVRGPNPTDMRVFWDQTINRWFVLQRVLDNDADGFPLNSSRIWLAVSQTADPVGTYNIYSIDTTDAQNFGCPCLADYPQIGADQYGFYISSNQYGAQSGVFVSAQIHAIYKDSLATGATAPTAYRFRLPSTRGYEFAIQPATTPPGASYFLGSGGLEYFVSSRTTSDNGLAIWALYNTSSLGTSSPNLLLTSIVVPALTYIAPDVATQRPGPLPYGSTLFPPGALAFVDGGSDSRILSVVYSGGRLYATLATQVTEAGSSLVGGAYSILSPAFRGGVLSSAVLRQGYLVVPRNHVLRPAIAVNPQGRGVIAFTLVGPDYFPSAAFLPIDSLSTGSVVQIAAAGVAPEDGFTGYPGGIGPGLARWGDYSAAVAASDGSIWMATEYIPNAPRTEFANWGTFLAKYIP